MMIRFGIVGTGKISGWFLEGARQDPRFQAVAVYSRNKETAVEFCRSRAGTLPLLRTYTSLEEMVESPDIDAVYIASPNSLHAEHSILCMNHGKHVLCEKPLASNVFEASKMIAAAHSNHVVLMEAMIATLNPNFLIVKSMLPELGAIRRYFGSFCQYSSRYDKLKENLATGSNAPIANAFNPAMSDSAIMDVGIYALYPMVALFGKPRDISATGTILPTGADGQGAVNFKYDDGMEATAIYSKIADSYLPSEIEGERGNIIMDQIHTIRSVTYVPHRKPMSGRGPETARQEVGHPLAHDEYYYEAEEFINIVESRDSGIIESSTNSLSVSLATMDIMDEIRRQLGVVFPADSHFE